MQSRESIMNLKGTLRGKKGVVEKMTFINADCD